MLEMLYLRNTDVKLDSTANRRPANCPRTPRLLAFGGQRVETVDQLAEALIYWQVRVGDAYKARKDAQIKFQTDAAAVTTACHPRCWGDLTTPKCS